MSAMKKDVLVGLKEKAAKLEAERAKLSQASTDILQFTIATNDREREVLSIFNERMRITQNLENVLDQILAHNRGEINLSKPVLSDLKNQKKTIFAQLAALPDIGNTRAEWESMNDAFKKKSVGRPAVSLEQRIIRVNKEFEETIKQIKELDANFSPDEIVSMSMDSSVVEKKNGRPKHDALGNLDTKLKNIRSKIEYITSGAHQHHVESRLKDSIYSEKGKRLGRSFEDPEVKLQRLRGEEAKILKTIETLEAKLEGDDLVHREIKKMRDLRNILKTKLDNEESASASQALELELNAVLDTLSELESKVKGTKTPTKKYERPMVPEYQAIDIQGTAQKPVSIVQHLRNTDMAIENNASLEQFHDKEKEDQHGKNTLKSINETRESVSKLITRDKK